MTGLDLPDECPECGYDGGWYVEGDYALHIDPDGKVNLIGTNTTRWGQKVEARCNIPNCDVVVDIYIEARAVNNGTPESTGARELKEQMKQHDIVPEVVEQECGKCGEELLTSPEFRIGSDGGLEILSNKICSKHTFSSLLLDNVGRIDPEEIGDTLNALRKRRENRRD